MARIRTIKPDFMDSGSTRRLSRDARLFFLQLLTEADDKGRLKDSPKRLAGVLYPGDEDVESADIARWIDECVAEGMLTRYVVNSEKYLWVTNFLTHQKISHPSESKLPDPSEHEPEIAPDLDSGDPPEKLRNTPEENVRVQEKPSTEREREQGKGTGKGNREATSATLIPLPSEPFQKNSREGFFDSDPQVVQNHMGIRQRVVSKILNDAISNDGKKLTPRERKQLQPQIDEWLVVGYEQDAISKAISASPYKTPNAVGGELRKSSNRATPESWNMIGNLYEQALEEERNAQV